MRLRHPVRIAVVLALLAATAGGAVTETGSLRGTEVLGSGSRQRTGAGTKFEARHLVRAEPAPFRRLTLVAAGDIACDPRNPLFNGGKGTGNWCQADETERLIARLDPTAVLVLGDAQYDDGRIRAFERSYDLSWGRHLGTTFAVPGNHEYETTGARGYFRYFGQRAGPAPTGWYSFDLGKWHVIALNSNCVEVGCARGSSQYRWLRRDLDEDRSSCSIAFMHHPLVSSGPHGDEDPGTEALWRLLYRDGLDVALVSHDHIYERFAPLNPRLDRDAETGIRQFVVGTGGSQLYWIEKVRRHSRVRNTETFGLLRLSLGRRSYSWRFVPAVRGGFTDSGTGYCHGPAT